uniref:Pectinesterase inhibitor domain-containing protein n=1 Tax=Poecilia reticulata TaxID=8081 RepID=A0A3P9MVB8_POERE
MSSCLASLAGLFVFLLAASAAPAGHHDACAEVRMSSQDLNQYARTASAKARNGSTDFARYSNSIAWLESNDMCDPASLKQMSTACVEKILGVLTSYASAVERISAFESCSEFTSTVNPALKKLHRDMGKCVRSLGGKLEKEHHGKKAEHHPVEHWKEAFVCQYTLERLFSFSILTARVFAAGDPAQHSEGSSHRCS